MASVRGVLKGLAWMGLPYVVRAATYDLDGTPLRRCVGFIKNPEDAIVELGLSSFNLTSAEFSALPPMRRPWWQCACRG
jgi:hypothetical protein